MRALPGAWVAQNEQGEVRAFLALGESMPYVPAPDGPELYVRVLVASRDARVRGIGRRMMAFVDEQARCRPRPSARGLLWRRQR